VIAGPCIGIDYACVKDRRAPWRLAVADNPWVSARNGLSALR
jgi:DNA-3-methyladenine glycosylase